MVKDIWILVAQISNSEGDQSNHYKLYYWTYLIPLFSKIIDIILNKMLAKDIYFMKKWIICILRLRIFLDKKI